MPGCLAGGAPVHTTIGIARWLRAINTDERTILLQDLDIGRS